MITLEQLKKILPNNKVCSLWIDLINKYLPKYDINTKDRMVMFFAQTSHESNQFRVLKENLNYSRYGLLKTFKKYFNESNVDKYIGKPELIASRVYANRMGNGDEASRDGWKYFGKGVIQTTGKENTSAFATYINKNLEDTCKYLLTREGALESACFYWKENQLNSFADVKDIKGATRRINGGLIGIEERTSEYNRISAILK